MRFSRSRSLIITAYSLQPCLRGTSYKSVHGSSPHWQCQMVCTHISYMQLSQLYTWVLSPQLIQLSQGIKTVSKNSLSLLKFGICIMYVEFLLRKRHQGSWISTRHECSICLTGLTQMLQQLGLATLEQRRKEASLDFLYKIVNEKVAVGRKEHLDRSCTSTRRNHNQQFRTIWANSDAYKVSFYEQYQCGITSTTILSIVPSLNNLRHN